METYEKAKYEEKKTEVEKDTELQKNVERNTEEGKRNLLRRARDWLNFSN